MAEYRPWVKGSLFLSSYIPLWLAMALKIEGIRFNLLGWSMPWISAIFVLISILSGVVLWQALEIRKSKEPDFVEIQSYKSRHDLVTSYLIPYLFPFVNLNYDLAINWGIFGIFFIVLGAIQIRSAHLHVNPVLAIFGYNIFEINDDSKGTSLLVAKRSINLEYDSVKAVELSKRVYLCV